MKRFAGMLLALTCMATHSGCKMAPELEVKITPSAATIPDTSKRGTPLATVSVRWSDGAQFTGEVRLTKNEGGLCQLSGMELQLSRDTTKADDYTTLVCTVTAIKSDNGLGVPLGTVPSSHLRGIGFDLIVAILAPNDEAHLGSGCTVKRHRWAGLGFQ